VRCSPFESRCSNVPTTEMPTVLLSSVVFSSVSEGAWLSVAVGDSSLAQDVSDGSAGEVMGSGGMGDLVGWSGLPPKGGRMWAKRPFKKLPEVCLMGIPYVFKFEFESMVACRCSTPIPRAIADVEKFEFNLFEFKIENFRPKLLLEVQLR
jgi:hypothetical protein